MIDNRLPQPLSEDEQMLVAGYVLGDLTDDEVAQLERLMASNPAILTELQAMQTSYASVPQAIAPVAPPPQLRDSIQHAFAQTSAPVPATSDPTSVPSPAAPTRRPNQQPNQRPNQRQWVRSLLRLLGGAAVLATLALGTDNWRLRSQLRLAQQVSPDRVAAILQQPNSRLISLAGNETDAAGTLLFTPGRWQEVIVSLGNLPPLPPEQIYHMWLGLENGEVIYCGEFNTETDGSVFVRFTPLESPPEGVKATELFVTVNADDTTPDPDGPRVMEGAV